MGTKKQNELVKAHLDIGCKKCGMKVRFNIRYGTYSKCKCTVKRVKDTSLKLRDEDYRNMSKATEHMEPFKDWRKIGIVKLRQRMNRRGDIAGA